MGLMPSFIGGFDAVGVKVVAAFPGNFGTEYDTHQGVVLFFDTERGLLRAIVDATSITAIRTAAVSGLVTDLLANPDAGDLAIIGAGTQAHTHLQAMRAVRPVRRVRVYSVPAESAAEFAERESRATGLQVEAVATAEEAVAGADIICTTTTATEPVVLGAWVAPGAHVNAVGAYTPTTRELDSDLVAERAALRRPSRIPAERGGRVPHPEGRGSLRRRAHRRRDRRRAHRQGSRRDRRPTTSPCSSPWASPSRIWLPRTASTRSVRSAGSVPGSRSVACTSARPGRTDRGSAALPRVLQRRLRAGHAARLQLAHGRALPARLPGRLPAGRAGREDAHRARQGRLVRRYLRHHGRGPGDGRRRPRLPARRRAAVPQLRAGGGGRRGGRVRVHRASPRAGTPTR